VSDLDVALELAGRGADFVVTRHVRALGEAMRAHAAASATPDPGTTTVVRAQTLNAATATTICAEALTFETES
jgi:hypothetical protein